MNCTVFENISTKHEYFSLQLSSICFRIKSCIANTYEADSFKITSFSCEAVSSQGQIAVILKLCMVFLHSKRKVFLRGVVWITWTMGNCSHCYLEASLKDAEVSCLHYSRTPV